MVRRTAIPILVCSLVFLAGACGSSASGPTPLASCTTASTVGTHITLAVGAYLSLDPATDSGCVLFPTNATANQAEYLLVPQSASGTPNDSSAFQLMGGTLSASTLPAALRLAGPSSPRATAVAFDAYRRGLARRQAAAGGVSPLVATSRLPVATQATAPQPAGPPVLGSLRTFTVCANLTCRGTGGTKQVTAKVTTLGQHIAIYVDTLAPQPGLNAADLDTLKNVFDARLFPLDTAAFGQVTDVDTNGVVLVLMTGVVNSLVTSAVCKSSGFVAGFFWPSDLDLASLSPGNRGEIFYSIVADSAGTLSCVHSRAEVKRELGGTFTHELQHMINYGQHVLIQLCRCAEEGWLDEGLSKYAEELAGRSYLQQGDTATFSSYAINDVYDAYQYLSATGTSPLLIPIDQGTLAEVGASSLFVRYLVDQFGDTLPRKLVRTTLTGSPNVAAQTGQPFTTSVTRWALANWVSDLPGFTTPAELTYKSWHFRTRTFPSLNAQDPAHFPLPYPLVPGQSAGNAISISGWIRSGSGVYQRAFQDPSAPAFALLFSPNGNAAPFPTNVVARLSVIRIR
jgi:hypothetical protein